MARITGTVTGKASQKPLAGALVSVTDGSYNWVATDEAGRYEIRTAKAGKMDLYFIAPSNTPVGERLAIVGVVVEPQSSVVVDVQLDESTFRDPSYVTMEGEFVGHFCWGFESSTFEPWDSSIQLADGSVRKPRSIWVSLDNMPTPSPFAWGDMYQVRWRATISGPGMYGHLGGSDYLMEVSELLEWKHEERIRTLSKEELRKLFDPSQRKRP